MAEQADGQKALAGKAHRLWVRWRYVLLVPATLGLVWGFFIWWYPFSLVVLPLSPLLLVVVLGIRALAGARFSVDGALLRWFPGYVVLTLIGSGCIDSIEYSRRSVCSYNLRGIALALLNYEHE